MDMVNLIFKADTRDIERAGEALDTAAKKVDSLTGALTPLKAGFAALTGALGIGILKSWFDTVVDGAAGLNNLATKTGLAVEQLSVMKQVAGQSGTAIEQVTQGIIRLQQSQAKAAKDTSQQAEAFRQLGISAKEVSGDTGELLGVVADRLAKTEDGWQKNSVVMALFGKEGTGLLEFLNDYADRGDTVAKITSDMAAQAENYERGMKKLGVVGTQFQQIFGLGVLPVADALVQSFVKLFNETGKLDTATKEMLKNKVTEWMWSFAQGIASVIDVANSAWALIRGFAGAIVIMGGAVAGFGDIMWSIVNGRFSEAAAKYDALKQTLADVRSENDKILAGFGSTAAQDFVNNARQAAEAKAAGGSPTEPKTKIKGVTGGETDGDRAAADAERERQRMERLKEQLLGKSVDLYNQQGDALDKLLGKDVEKNKLEREFNELIDKANKNGLSAVATEIDKNKQLALAKQARADEIKDAQKVLELMQQQAAAAEELQNLAYGWQRKVKETTFSSLVTRSMSPQELADMEFENVRGGIQSEASSKSNAKFTQANKLRASNDPADQEKANELEREAMAIIDAMQKSVRQLEINYKKAQETSDDYWAGMKAGAKSFADSLPTVNKAFADFSQKSLGDFSNRLTSLVTTGKFGFKDFIKSMLDGLAQLAVQLLIVKPLMQGLGLGGLMMKNGGAFSSGVQMYANGDVFGSPTMFRHAGGLGVLGEAGPEGVMPLRRNARGELGVIAQGSGGDSSIQIGQIQVNVQGGQTNAETGQVVSKAIADQMRQIADSRISEATRSGGIIRRAMA